MVQVPDDYSNMMEWRSKSVSRLALKPDAVPTLKKGDPSLFQQKRVYWSTPEETRRPAYHKRKLAEVRLIFIIKQNRFAHVRIPIVVKTKAMNENNICYK